MVSIESLKITNDFPVCCYVLAIHSLVVGVLKFWLCWHGIICLSQYTTDVRCPTCSARAQSDDNVGFSARFVRLLSSMVAHLTGESAPMSWSCRDKASLWETFIWQVRNAACQFFLADCHRLTASWALILWPYLHCAWQVGRYHQNVSHFHRRSSSYTALPCMCMVHACRMQVFTGVWWCGCYGSILHTM